MSRKNELLDNFWNLRIEEMLELKNIIKGELDDRGMKEGARQFVYVLALTALDKLMEKNRENRRL